MSTYYELLKIARDATSSEITAAFDTQYNQCRQLTTHHDPNVADQATQLLRMLETARATLTDPAKRTEYDAMHVQNVGGLAALEELLRTVAPLPTGLGAKQKTGSAGTPVDAWQCPNCGHLSPRGTRFCEQCSTQIGMDCPKCGKLTRAGAPHCSECGVSIETELQRQRQAQEENKRQQEALAFAELETKLRSAERELAEIEAVRTRSALLPKRELRNFIVILVVAMLISLAFVPDNVWFLPGCILLVGCAWLLLHRVKRLPMWDEEIQAQRRYVENLRGEVARFQRT